MKVLLLYQQCDWSLSHWRKPERSILIENSDVMDREGTSQAPSFHSLLLAVSLFRPPSSSLFPSLFFFFHSFFFVLAGYSFCSSGITEPKPNSSLARSREGTTSRAVCAGISISIHKYVAHSSLSPPFVSMLFHSVANLTPYPGRSLNDLSDSF